MTTILGIALVVIGGVGLFWRIGRTWDRAYELGWQHGRRQMENDNALSSFQERRRRLEIFEGEIVAEELVN